MTNDKPSPEKRHRKFFFAAATALAIALAAATIYAAVSQNAHLSFLQNTSAKQPASPTPPPAIVKAQHAAQRDEPVIINGLGTVQAWNTITVRSRVDGAIEKIAFDEGAMVKEGDTLIELDSRPFIAARDQARAQIAQDQAQLDSAQKDLVRTTALEKNSYATRQLLDQQTANVERLKALVTADDAALANAEAQLGYTEIKAPLSGRIGLRSVDIGNLVRATDAGGVVTITQVEPISVLFTAPEKYLDQIIDSRKAGALAVAAYSPDGKRLLARGQLDSVDNIVDVNSGSIRLKARFDNADDKLWPGQSVTTRLTISTIPNAVVVPDGAVQRGPTSQFAYVVRPDSTAELRTIEVSQIQDGWAVIKSGITAGEQVVTSGQYKVQPGSRLDVDANATKAADAESLNGGID